MVEFGLFFWRDDPWGSEYFVDCEPEGCVTCGVDAFLFLVPVGLESLGVGVSESDYGRFDCFSQF